MTIDDANTALAVASNTEQRLAALRHLAEAARDEIERLQPGAPDWSCHHCRMTWVGGTTPPKQICSQCGQALTAERR